MLLIYKIILQLNQMMSVQDFEDYSKCENISRKKLRRVESKKKQENTISQLKKETERKSRESSLHFGKNKKKQLARSKIILQHQRTSDTDDIDENKEIFIEPKKYGVKLPRIQLRRVKRKPSYRQKMEAYVDPQEYEKYEEKLFSIRREILS